MMPARRLTILGLCLFIYLVPGQVAAQDSLNVTVLGSIYGQWDDGWGVAVSGDYAYLAVENVGTGGGLSVVDISDPSNPVEVGSCVTPTPAGGVAVSGEYAYVAAHIMGASGSLRVVDVSDPSNPVEVGSCDTPSSAQGVAVSGDYAYVAAAVAGLRVVDISDPSNPAEVGHCDMPYGANGVALSGDYAYVADGVPIPDNENGSLRVVDISAPSNPVETGYCSMPQPARGVAVSGDYAYVTESYWIMGSLRAVDISDPLNPVETGYCDVFGPEFEVAVSDANAYVVSASGGLRVVDVSDPSNLVEIGYDASRSINGVAGSGDYAYVVGAGYFAILDCSGAPVLDQPNTQVPTSFALMAPSPNPFSRETYIAFDLPQALEVRALVCDISGRMVMTDELGMLDAGRYRYILNCSGLSSGTYFLRLEAEPHSAVRKILLVK